MLISPEDASEGPGGDAKRRGSTDQGIFFEIATDESDRTGPAVILSSRR